MTFIEVGMIMAAVLGRVGARNIGSELRGHVQKWKKIRQKSDFDLLGNVFKLDDLGYEYFLRSSCRRQMLNLTL
jgi:hypothetical protein